MRRTDRLFEILQLFRQGKTLLGKDIAEKLEVSVRTIYRDIDTLVASGMPIEGERGVGYILRAPIFLPPLTLTVEEMRALQLGAEIVRQTSDATLSDAAQTLLKKVSAVVPQKVLADAHLKEVSVYVSQTAASSPLLGVLQSAVRRRQIVHITYQSLSEETTKRDIQPLQTEYWGHAWTCVAWCRLKADFRVFRVDKIVGAHLTERVFSHEQGKRYQDYLDQLNFVKKPGK